ncbi:MAG: hypothetical protein ACXWMW_00260, partial [Syntrophales bacterium]
IKHPLMKRLILPHIAGVLTCLERHARIGKQQPRAEFDAEFVASFPDVFVHLFDIGAGEPLRIGYSFRRRLGMQLKAQPVILDIKYLF